MRVRYAKRGRLRFTSHRDFSRAFERALVRARIPMAYSSGFNPHPRISYAGASPTGAASEAEYLEIGLAQQVDPATLAGQLDEALPEGLDVLQVVEARPGSLAGRLGRGRTDDQEGPAHLRQPGRRAGDERHSVRRTRRRGRHARARRDPDRGRRAAHRAGGPARRRTVRTSPDRWAGSGRRAAG